MAKVLVTGASSGIGKQLVRVLISKGHAVWAVSRNKHLLQQNGEEFDAVSYRYSVCDVSVKEHWRLLHQQMDLEGFVPDVLFLNAGVTSNSADENFAVNYNGVLYGINEFITSLRQNNGKVLVSGSLFAFVNAPFNVSYGQSKRKVFELLQQLSNDPDNSNVLFRYFVLGPVDVSKGKLPVAPWKSLFIPSANQTAEYMVKKLGDDGLMYKFPVSATVLILANRLLPRYVMDGLVNRLKR